jgi:hypothetical protein
MAFRVGDKVVKASTTVPYQPWNPGHVIPREAMEELREQTAMMNMFADMGMNVLRAEFVEAGDRGFQIHDYLEIPKQLTREQLHQVQDTEIKMHEAGYALQDWPQVGIDSAGRAMMYDTGKAQAVDKNNPHVFEYDNDMLVSLYTRNDQPFTDRTDAQGKNRWAKLLFQLYDRKDFTDEQSAKFWAVRVNRLADETIGMYKLDYPPEDLPVLTEMMNEQREEALTHIAAKPRRK